MEEIDKNKKLYILLGVLLIIVFLIITNLIKNNLNAKVDYNSDDVVADLLKSATITYDRETYYILESIIVDYINSGDTNYDIENGKNYEAYYDVLNETYKSKLGKSKYKAVAEQFFKKFEYVESGAMDSQTLCITTNIIRSIYDLGDDRYLCILAYANDSEVGYIGISLNSATNTYEIFYLE